MKVLQFPLAKVTLCFIAGILAAQWLDLSSAFVFSLLSVSLSFFALLFLLSNKHNSIRPFFGVAVFLVSFGVGMSTLTIHNASADDSNYSHRIYPNRQNHRVEIILRERLRSSARNERYIALVHNINHHTASGRILVNFRKDGFDGNFQIGSHLLVYGKVYKPRKPDNPDQFDYGSYLINKSILAQMYVGASEVKTSTDFNKDAFYYADQLRNRVLENLKLAHFGKAELAVVAALILGQQQDIAPEILQDYQFAGAIHILSVSGLHVGFLLIFLNFLLDYLPKNKVYSLVKLLTILASLWGFAIIAGLSPSVVRSVTMFSFVAVGMHFKRQTNIFHTLLVSMLLILLFEPSFLFDVGFQLSYLALFFILWIQPLLTNIWTPKYKIITYFWEILTVSFAAQLGTLPLSIYYFHQFPGLFFVTNMVIIPFLAVIMGLGVVVLVWSAVKCPPPILASALEWSIFILNKIIGWIAHFEQFIFRNIPFNTYMLLGLYAVIITAVLCFEKPNFKRIAIALAAFVAFQGIFFESRWSNQNKQEWIVFNARKSTVIAARKGEEVSIWSNQQVAGSIFLQSYLTANFCHLKSVARVPNTAYFNSKKILLIDSLGWYPQHAKPEIIVMRQSPKINIDRLLLAIHPEIIVADGSNFKSYVKRWEQTCRKEKIPFHATAEKGFYRLE